MKRTFIDREILTAAVDPEADNRLNCASNITAGARVANAYELQRKAGETARAQNEIRLCYY